MENETPQSGNEDGQAAAEDSQAATEDSQAAAEDSPAAAEEMATATPQYAPEELNGGQKTDASRVDVNLDLVLDIPVEISIRVGSTDISIRDLVSLVEGSVISLDQAAGEPMDVLVNGTLIANGEIVIVDDQYGVRLIDVVSPVERVEQLH